MKNLFKTLTLIMVIIVGINASYALSVQKLDKQINNSDIHNSATIAISVRNAENNNIVYEQNQEKLLHPASTLKIFTTYFSISELGYDYFFKTKFYKDSSNNLYIKTGADPMFSTTQLKQALERIKQGGNGSFKNLYIDDSIVDKKEFAPGWMWDDDINPYTPKVSAYNLDGNVVKVSMLKSANGLITTSVKSDYPMSVISNIKSDAKTNYIEVNRYNWSNPDVTEIIGEVKSPADITIPISSMRRYFIHNLEKALEEVKINISESSYTSKIVPENAELLTETANSVKRALPEILQNSNNLMAESLFKVAGAVKYSSTGTTESSVKAFKEFYKNMGIDTDDIIVKDGSGVSRNNLLTADWMTNTLDKIYKSKDFDKFQDYMAQSGDGTLINRLYDLRGSAWLKTGSLSNISAIAGYVNSLDGHTYSVAILIQNFKEPQTEIKQFENELINIIYNK